MKKIILTTLIFTIYISCANTTKSDSDLEEFQTGNYCYTAYDSNNKKLVNGRIELFFDSDSILKGNWDLSLVNTNIENHPHSGSGEIVGNLNNDTLWLNLHPGWADHNIILKGQYNNGEITGSWSYISFIGLTDGGNFEAEYCENEN